jgi:hypothetical protein
MSVQLCLWPWKKMRFCDVWGINLRLFYIWGHADGEGWSHHTVRFLSGYVNINIKAVILNTHWIKKRNLRHNLFTILGAFTKLRKVTISFVVSLCLSNRMEQLGCHWADFHELWYLSIFRKSVEKIQVSLKSTRITGNLHKDHDTWYLAYFILEWEMFQTKFIEKIKTYIVCSVTFFFRISYRLWDNMEKYYRAV